MISNINHSYINFLNKTLQNIFKKKLHYPSGIFSFYLMQGLIIKTTMKHVHV
jgi:hypothetical protein